jgi:hypothetical protein
MPNYGGISQENKGVLECYRKVCNRKLGTYNMEGIRCHCGQTIKPGFQIAKNKVKLVGPNSN